MGESTVEKTFATNCGYSLILSNFHRWHPDPPPLALKRPEPPLRVLTISPRCSSSATCRLSALEAQKLRASRFVLGDSRGNLRLAGASPPFQDPNLDKKQKKNHTSKLQELALLLPLALKTSNKKLTKKEILLHILHYIHFLQRSINVAKSLLSFYMADGEGAQGGLGQNPAAASTRPRYSTPSSSPFSAQSHFRGGCRKPQKKKLIRASEHHTRTQSPRRCLVLGKTKKEELSCPDQQGGSIMGLATPLSSSDRCHFPKSELSLPQDDRKESRSQQMLPDVAENKVHCTISGCFCRSSPLPEEPHTAWEAQVGDESIHFLIRTQNYARQKLLHYNSRDKMNKELPDADPWLPTWNPVDSPQGSPLNLGPHRIDDWNATRHPREILNLSPSLFSNPGKLPPKQLLDDGTEYLTQGALFEDTLLDPVTVPVTCKLEVPQNDTAPGTPEDSPDLQSRFQSSVTLDHCYLSLSDNSKTSSSSSEETDTESAPIEQPEGLPSSSDDGDYTWTPTRKASTVSTAGKKARKGQGVRAPMKPRENKKAPCSTLKKKCVNGFIMFCRMNRKQYIRACPGTASTAATKELAQLWRMMTPQEQRPYCIKARRFSRQHNRNVKQAHSSSEDDNGDIPKPFYQLLAEKARKAQGVPENPYRLPLPRE
ncbi:meiosis initiator protein [Sorex fumeus]|uniref:meiosis initiator protein n=1 Tax=Sorex fumeus TaxID=62283 RepID=UPI0024ACC6A9|nr:meiosis initiator protein [Sorex fumeus]